MKKKWLVAAYKTKEVKRVESNLLNQKFDYYLPKIKIKKNNLKPREEVLFPGYIFINTDFENYSVIKNTKGIKNIIKFGDNIPYISKKDIETIRMLEEISKTNPLLSKIKVGQEVTIKEGSFKGSIAKVCSLPTKERVAVLLHFLGSMRRVVVLEKNLSF